MARVMLFHWNADEAKERAARLTRWGHEAVVPTFTSGTDLKTIAADPPDAFVIDLSRLPSHGREIAAALRERKATRAVPIVFVDGAPEKVARVRALLPDATYTDWTHLRGALRTAMRHPPASPVVPGPMAGYSGTPLPKKLGIKHGSVVALRSAPRGFERTLGQLPDGSRVIRGARRADVTLLFVRSRAELARRLPHAARALATGQGLWIAWPKRSAGTGSDLTQQHVRERGLALGIVDYKVCAIDETWSGLLFARRAARVR
jgi:CheY-like chemotaxis protein